MHSKLKLLSFLVGSIFTASVYAQCSTNQWVGNNPTNLTTGTSGSLMAGTSSIGTLASGTLGSSSGLGLGSFNGGSLSGLPNGTGSSNNILGGLGNLVGGATGLSNITSGNATLSDYIKAGSTVATTYGLVTGNKTATAIGGVGLVAGNAFGSQINSMGSSIFSAFETSNSGMVQSDGGQFSNVNYGNTSSNSSTPENGVNGQVYNQDTSQWSTPYQGTTAASLETPTGESPGWKDGGTRYVPTVAESSSNNSGAGTWMNPTSVNETTSNPGATSRGDLGLTEGESMSFSDASPKSSISSLSPAGNAGTLQASRDTDWSGKGASNLNVERPWVTNSDGINVPWGSAKDNVTPSDATLTAVGSKGDTYTLTRDQATASDAADKAKYIDSMNNYQAPAQITTESLNSALNKAP